MKKKSDKNDVVIYQGKNGAIELRGDFKHENIWATLDQIAGVFGRDKSVISRHLKNVFNEHELDRNSVVAKNATTATDGKTYQVEYFNLDAILSVGYRVNSKVATQFRIWATKRLNEYIRKGFTMDDERLKNLGGGGYWKELLQRIRDIRASEKVFYRQVLDIYSTSMDYDPKAEVSVAFFKKVQNKIYLRQTPISFKR